MTSYDFHNVWRCRSVGLQATFTLQGTIHSACVPETAARLMEESPKAQTAGRPYADLTARNAALAVERRRQQPSRSGPIPGR